jgi:hypothetical protein
VSVVINQLFEAGKIKTGARSCRVSAKQVLAQKIHYLEMAIFKNQAEGTNLKKKHYLRQDTDSKNGTIVDKVFWIF